MICVECHEPCVVMGDGPCPGCGGIPTLAGRWRLEDVVGRGATGTVFRATAITAEGAAGGGSDGSTTTVAIKELPLRSDPKRQELALREARVLRQLQHPSIPRYLEEIIAGHGRGRCLYLVEEFVDGESLARRMENHRFDEGEVLDVIADALDILGWLHGLAPPVLHRDVKPGNLIRRASDGRWMLVDFGSVRDVLRAEASGSTVAGTFGYMAPEQFRGDARPATDLYAVGATAVALLSRQDPATLHDRDGRFEWRSAVQVSDETSGLLAELLATDPEKRLGDAKVAAARARAIRAGLGRSRGEAVVPVRPTPPPRIVNLDGPIHAPIKMKRGHAVMPVIDPFLATLPPELPAVRERETGLGSLDPRPTSGQLQGGDDARGWRIVLLGFAAFTFISTFGLVAAGGIGAWTYVTAPMAAPAAAAPAPVPTRSAPPPAAHYTISRPTTDADNSPETIAYNENPVPADLVGQPDSTVLPTEIARATPVYPEGQTASAACTVDVRVNPDGTVGAATIGGCPVAFRNERAIGDAVFDALPAGAAREERKFHYTYTFDRSGR